MSPAEVCRIRLKMHTSVRIPAVLFHTYTEVCKFEQKVHTSVNVRGLPGHSPAEVCRILPQMHTSVKFPTVLFPCNKARPAKVCTSGRKMHTLVKFPAVLLSCNKAPPTYCRQPFFPDAAVGRIWRSWPYPKSPQNIDPLHELKQ